MIFQESLWMHIYQRRGRQQRMRNSFDKCTDDLISTIGWLRSIERWKIIGQHWKSMRSVNTDCEYFGQIDSLSILDQVLEREKLPYFESTDHRILMYKHSVQEKYTLWWDCFIVSKKIKTIMTMILWTEYILFWRSLFLISSWLMCFVTNFRQSVPWPT